MKKLLWGFIILMFAFGALTACGNNDSGEDTPVNDAPSEALVETNDTQEQEPVDKGDTEGEPTEANPGTELEPDETVTPEEGIERVAEPGGMNLGNIANSGFWTFQGPELLYTAGHDLGIYNLETGDLSKLDHHGGHHKYIVGNDLYFSHITGVRKADLRTGDYEQLGNQRARYINIQDDWIYFVNSMDSDTVYRMKTDGSDLQQLSTLSSVRCLLQYDGYLYFNPNSENNRLYRMKLDGSDLVMINDQWIPFFMIYEDKLYMSQHGEYGIYQSALDGSGKSKLTDYYGDYFNIVNDHIFYSNSVENYQFYRMNLDGSENQLWLDQRVNYICVNDNYLYFFNDKDPDLGVVRMHYDSRELEAMNLPRTF